MSANGDSGPGRREVAYRLFAAEFDDASLSYSESDEERAPNYVVTPTGLRVNRLFAVGVLTEVESINEDTLRGRIVDPTGAFVTYAGQYQPPAQAFLDGTTPPAFVAITGKARTFEPEDSDRVFTSVRPESLSEVDADTRDRWVVSAAESTLHRITVCAAALESSLRGEELQAALSEAGVDDSLAVGIPRALDHYGTTTAYLDGLRQLAIDALEVVADERDEVRSLDVAPGEGDETALGELPAVDLALESQPVSTSEPAATDSEATATDSEATAMESAADAPTENASADSSPPASGETPDTPESTAEPESPDVPIEPETGAESEQAAESASEQAADSAPGTDSSTEPAVDTPNEPEPSTETVAASEPDTATVNGAADPDAEAETVEDDSTAADSAEEPGMYQLDEEEREELEAEFDTGFSSGNEVDPAGEADIDVPDVDELAKQAEAETEPTAETDIETDDGDKTDETLGDFDDGDKTDETLGDFDDGMGDFEDDADKTEPASEEADTAVDDAAETAAAETAADNAKVDAADDHPAEDVDLEEAVVEMMGELDTGDGVDRDQLVTDLVEAHGVDEAAVEDAIDDALMGGRCYEPEDGTLKAI